MSDAGGEKRVQRHRIQADKEALREERRRKRRRVQQIQIGVICLIILAIGYTIYDKVVDMNKIDCRTYVYWQRISHMTVDEAAEKLEKRFEATKLVFKEQGKTVYETTLGEAGYTLDQEALKTELQKLADNQHGCWGLLQLPDNHRIAYQVKEDTAKKAAALSASHFTAGKARNDSVDAQLSYNAESGRYEIAAEQQGNQIDETRLTAKVDEVLEASFEKSPLKKKVTVKMDTDVYKAPEVVGEQTQILEEQAEMNERLQNYPLSSITYTFGDVEEVLDSATIQSWIVQGENEVHLDEEAMLAYIDQLKENYDTYGVTRELETSLDFTATIERNEYGYRIDRDGELAQMYEDIRSGQAVRREPVYSETGMGRNGNDDLLGSYIEVSIYNQHLWLYKDGGLVTDTDIISGKPVGINTQTGEEEDWSTLYGAFSIVYLQSPSVLSSEIYGYETEVQYWMPFEDGQGLHDATWQSYFGGNTYLTNGSHGCINLPLDQAALIYANIDAGYPIIIY